MVVLVAAVPGALESVVEVTEKQMMCVNCGGQGAMSALRGWRSSCFDKEVSARKQETETRHPLLLEAKCLFPAYDVVATPEQLQNLAKEGCCQVSWCTLFQRAGRVACELSKKRASECWRGMCASARKKWETDYKRFLSAATEATAKEKLKIHVDSLESLPGPLRSEAKAGLHDLVHYEVDTKPLQVAVPTRSDLGQASSVAVAPSTEGDVAGVDLKPGYDVKQLLKDFGGVRSHKQIVKVDQRRWELYSTLAIMMQRVDGFSSALAVAELPALKKLRINRNKLSSVFRQLSDDGTLPKQCPSTFRTGRAAATSLTLAERQAFLQYIQRHAAHGNALSVKMCHDALTLWAMQKAGVLADILDDPAAIEARLEALRLGRMV